MLLAVGIEQLQNIMVNSIAQLMNMVNPQVSLLPSFACNETFLWCIIHDENNFYWNSCKYVYNKQALVQTYLLITHLT